MTDREPEPDTKRLEFLLSGADQFAVAIGMQAGLLKSIYNAESDWAFIIQIDAVIETAAREAIGKGLCIEFGGQIRRSELLDDFVSALPMNGRTSLGKLLRVAGCNADICDFIEAVRQIRNAFAHDIRRLNRSLKDVVLDHPDKNRILRRLAPVEQYDQAGWLSMMEYYPRILRFGIFDQTLVFLTLVYNVAMKKGAESA